MPHVIIEHSSDLTDTVDMQALCRAVYDALAAAPEVPNPATLKIRALSSSAWVLGTERQSYAHAMLLALPGRTAAQKAAMTETVLGVLKQQMPDVGSLSVNYSDLDDAYTIRTL